MTSVGVRELKNQLRKHLKRVRQGQRIVLAEHGRAIATIEPVDAPALLEWAKQMIREGKARWSGGKPLGARTPRHAPNARLAEAVIEDRDDRA